MIPFPLTPRKFKSSNSESKELHLLSTSKTPKSSKQQKSKQSDRKSESKRSDLFSYYAKSPKTPSYSDRFVMNRASIDFDYCNNLLSKTVNNENTQNDGTQQCLTPSRVKYSEEINSLRELNRSSSRLLSCFDSTSRTGQHNVHGSNILKPHVGSVEVSQLGAQMSPKRTQRHIQSFPTRILDAPELMNDYYLNLLHWGQNDILAVALTNAVYLWHASDGHIDTLLTLEDGDNYISSLQWSARDPNCIAIGTNNNVVELWDATRLHKIRELQGHSARISSLAWNTDSAVLSSGGRDSQILNHDIRERNSVQSAYSGHTQEVCGLAWSPDGMTLASGGNENALAIWDAAMSNNNTSSNDRSFDGINRLYQPRYLIDQHQAAVKAVAWCPWKRHVLASGGGTADRTIRIWNSANGMNTKCVDTGSQVCAIQWSDHFKELVSSHGFSDNQLILWQYPSMTKVQEFRGHTARVLHMTKSPNGNTICSASADETIRFWDLFNPSSSTSNSSIGVRRGNSQLSSSNNEGTCSSSSSLASSAVKRPRLLGVSGPGAGNRGGSLSLR